MPPAVHPSICCAFAVLDSRCHCLTGALIAWLTASNIACNFTQDNEIDADDPHAASRIPDGLMS